MHLTDGHSSVSRRSSLSSLPARRHSARHRLPHPCCVPVSLQSPAMEWRYLSSLAHGGQQGFWQPDICYSVSVSLLCNWLAEPRAVFHVIAHAGVTRARRVLLHYARSGRTFRVGLVPNSFWTHGVHHRGRRLHRASPYSWPRSLCSGSHRRTRYVRVDASAVSSLRSCSRVALRNRECDGSGICLIAPEQHTVRRSFLPCFRSVCGRREKSKMVACSCWAPSRDVCCRRVSAPLGCL